MAKGARGVEGGMPYCSHHGGWGHITEVVAVHEGFPFVAGEDGFGHSPLLDLVSNIVWDVVSLDGSFDLVVSSSSGFEHQPLVRVATVSPNVLHEGTSS